MPVRLADVRPPRPSGGAVRRRQVEWRHLEFEPKNEMRILSRRQLGVGDGAAVHSTTSLPVHRW